MKTILRRSFALLLVLAMFVGMVVYAPKAEAAATFPSSMYLLQNTNYTCTLCSNAMMLRARMYLSNNSNWSSITENGMRPYAWIEGAGQRSNYTYSIAGCTMNVRQAYVNGLSLSSLQSILNSHPEGIVLYCAGIPHAQWVTDIVNGVVYGGDPSCAAYGGRRPIANTYQGQCYGYSQSNVLAHATSYWYVSSYSIPANTNYGNNKALNPAVFNAGYYRSHNSDLSWMNDSQLQEHWLNHGIKEGRCASPAFDAKWYLQSQPDVRNAYGANNYEGAINHFVDYGMKEGRDSSPLLSFAAYKERYADLRNAFGSDNAKYYEHYAKYGHGEGRIAGIDNGTYTICAHDDANYVVDLKNQSKDGGAGSNLYQWHGGDSQKFAFERSDSGAYSIRNLNSGLYLEILYGGTHGEYKVTQCHWTGADCQLWYVIHQSDGSYSLLNKGTGKMMDLANNSVQNHTDVQTWDGNGSAAQKWWLSRQGALVSGVYKLGAKNNSNFVLNVCGNSHDNGANVWVWETGNNNGDKWAIVLGNDGYYTLRETGSNKYLDVAGGKREAGTNVQLYEGNGSDAQKWTAVRNTDGSYTFYSKCSGLALDLDNGLAQNGQNVHMWYGNYGDTQKWIPQLQSVLNNGTYFIGNAADPTYRLEIADRSKDNGGNLILFRAHGATSQQFRFEKQSDGTYIITNVNSGKQLDVAGGGKIGGTNIQQWAATGLNQKWNAIPNADGSYSFVSANSGLFMDLDNGETVNDKNIACWPCNDKTAQKWILSSTDVSVADGVYNIASAINGGFRAEVNARDTKDGASIILYTAHGAESQKFKFTSVGEGFYTIQSVHSGKYFDVAGGSKDNGANLQQYTGNGSDAQKFLILKNLDGTYSFIARHSGKAIDLDNGNTANDTNIHQWAYCASSANQKWNLTGASHIHNYIDTVVKNTKTEQGYTEHTCGCGDSYRDNYVAADGAAPVISDVKITEVSENGYRVTCKVSDNVGVTQVKMPTWTDANGQDDIVWHVASVSNGTATFYVKTSDHGYEPDAYITHIYAYDAVGNQVCKVAPAVNVPRLVADGDYRIVLSANDSFGLDVAGVSKDNGANIHLWTYGGGANQQFQIKYVGGGYYTIRAIHTNKALDVANGTAKEGTNVQQYDANGTDAQKWRFQRNADGSYTIVSKLGFALDVYNGDIANGSNVQIWASNGTNAQKWKLLPVTVDRTAPVISDVKISEVSPSGYRVTCKVSDNVGVTQVKMPTWTDANGQDDIIWHEASVSNGTATFYVKTTDHKNEFGTYITHIYAYDAIGNSICKEAPTVEVPITNGTYRIACAANQNIGLDVAGGGSNTSDGANLELWTYDASANQQFEVTYVKDGYYKIKAVYNGKAVDVSGPSTEPGTNVHMWAEHGGDNQLWKFVKNSNGSYSIVSKLGDNVVLDACGGNIANGTNMQVWTRNDSVAQQFTLIPVTKGGNGYASYKGGRGGSGQVLGYGVDVSEHQGVGFNFQNLKNQGYTYVILRCGFVTRKDYRFEEYYQAAKAAGLDVGVYFYSYATSVADASYEADRCLEYIAGKKFEYPVYFDFEDPSARSGNGALAKSICLTFLDKVAAKGYLVGLYGYAAWLDEDYGGWVPTAEICQKYECWIANYPYADYVNNYTEKYKYRYGMFQYTDGQASLGLAQGAGIDTDMCFKDYPSIVKQYGFNGY